MIKHIFNEHHDKFVIVYKLPRGSLVLSKYIMKLFGFSFSNASSGMEPVRLMTIDTNREGNGFNTFHNSINHIFEKTHGLKSVVNKVSFNPIIGFIHIQIETNIPFISTFIFI